MDFPFRGHVRCAGQRLGKIGTARKRLWRRKRWLGAVLCSLRRASRTVGAQPGELRRGDILAFLARLSHIRQAGTLVLPLRTHAATTDRCTTAPVQISI
jgi:hypothetical protein